MTIYEQLNGITLKHQPSVTTGIIEIRELRAKRKVSDQEYDKFWSKNQQWLEDKYTAEMHNKNVLIWLWSAYQENKNNDAGDAIMAKIQQAARFVREYADATLRCTTINLGEYDIPEPPAQAVAWDD